MQKHVNNIINTNLQFFSAPVRHKSETVGRVKPEMGTRFFYLVELFSLNIGKATSFGEKYIFIPTFQNTGYPACYNQYPDGCRIQKTGNLIRN